MTGRLSGKVAIITGATSGIGAATALLFAQEGANVVLTGRRASRGEEMRALCAQAGPRCLFVQADHTVEGDCQNVVERTLREFERIDIQSTLDTNVTSVWRMCRLVIPHMRKQRGGAIVNNASYWAVVGGANVLPYATSKGAVALMTKAMALDHAREGIRVNAVCPGGTFVERWSDRFPSSPDQQKAIEEASAHIPLQRFAAPEEIARAVLFLCADDSSYVTGHLLMADGGNTAQ